MLIKDLDCIMCCTGYEIKFPFFEEKDNIIEYTNLRKNSFGPLYKKIFLINDPNLYLPGAFLGAFSI